MTRRRSTILAITCGLAALGLWMEWTAPAGAQLAARPRQKAEPASFLEAGRKDPTEKVRWEKGVGFDFAKPDVMKDFQVAEGQWEARDGKLWAVEGAKNRTILLAHVEGQTLRIEFQATCYADEEGRLGDISVLLNASPQKAPTNSGYALTTASYYNTCTTFYRQGRKLARTEFSPVQAEKPNKVVVELDKGHIRYWINEQIVLEAWEDSPLAIDGKLWLGLRTYATKIAVSDFAVYRPAGTP